MIALSSLIQVDPDHGVDLYQQVFLWRAVPMTILAVALVCWGAFRKGGLAAFGFLMLGVLVSWFGLNWGVWSGYGAWQTMPEPGENAFADGAKLVGTLVGGWIPAALLGLPSFLRLRWWKRARDRRAEGLAEPAHT